MAATCDNPPPAGQKKRRAYHRKVRTGCATCKIRRLRCDETKPACVRCTSTGRTCDGYASFSPHTDSLSTSATGIGSTRTVPQVVPMIVSTSKPGADARLLLPRMNTREVRSYRYFLNVAAPALSGFFDADFWLVQIPRVAHCDAAIWHAIVCLGAVHESEGGPCATGDMDTALFGVEQFNKAIQALRISPNNSDSGIALTLSTIFATTSVCGNRYEQAMMHLDAGVKMLQDFRGDDLKPVVKASSQLKRTPAFFKSVPISIAPVRNIILRMNMTARALSHGALFGSAPRGEILENNVFRVWRSYTAPLSSSGKKSMLTPDIVLTANRASESLLNGLVFAAQEQNDALIRLRERESDRAAEIAWLTRLQRPYARGYRELSRALSIFEAELEKPICSMIKATRKQLTHAVRPLRLYLATCRIIMVANPDNQKLQTLSSHADLCSSILKNAEEILSLDDTWLELESGTKVAFTSNSMTMDALYMCAHSSPNLAQRRLAARLMRRPRSEGLWPTLMASRLADAVLDRETEALQELQNEAPLRTQQILGNGPVASPHPESLQVERQFVGAEHVALEEAKGYDEADSPHGLHRVRRLILNLENGRQAKLTMQTWGDSINGLPGKESILRW